MKILILVDAWFPFVGGAQVQIKNLKKNLENNYNCHYHILHSPSVNIFVRFLWGFWVIPQAIYLHRIHHYDLIHAHAYWAGLPGIIISKLIKRPIVFTVHGSNLLDIKSHSLKSQLEKYLLTHIKYDQEISVTKKFTKHPNVNKSIVVIPNGVNVEAFDNLAIKKEKPFKILFVGRNDPIKGLKYLQEAMIDVKKKFPYARLRIVNNIFDESTLIKEYKSSHLFVLPSLSEGQPLTLLEAWAAKLPVVVTEVGDNTELVKNGYNGYLVKPRDKLKLSEVIIELLGNKNIDKIGKQGYLLVKRKYLWKFCAEKTFGVYKRVLDNY